ncbi:hypothetical protein QO002_001818 [Pararhizobium capsulatum DSM 1112]|uniref:Uncharacterized protein n=1 Tax=Pararhizobium capsulatum DSM 1112 TaxID=1121113 RepID=A0ABU0BN46_9HYPH|nr:hypothetical protein [Pararhizobium capsulatum]MDQ0319680.1 hypothetical protein [Pararhizobium capsulatum DSM 1112]
MTTIKDNIAASTDPSAANDTTEGYAPGSEWYNTLTGQMWRAISVASGAAQWMRLAPAPAWPTGYYRPPAHIYAVNDGQVAANKLTMMPLLIHRRVTIDRIALWLVTGQTGAEMRLGLYRSDAFTEMPGTLFAEAGTVDLSGSASLKTITVSWSLVPGQYWLAALNKASGTLPTVVALAAPFSVMCSAMMATRSQAPMPGAISKPRRVTAACLPTHRRW